MAVGEARRVLIIGPDACRALRLQEELASMAGRRVWLWHESSLAQALTVLSMTHFQVVLLDPDAGDEPWMEMAREVRRLVPGATVILYGEVTSELTVPKDNPAEAARILLRLLGLVNRRGRSQ